VDAHAHVSWRAERRNGKIGYDLQLLQPAVGGDRERSHALVVPLYLVSNPKRQRREEQRDLLGAVSCLFDTLMTAE
jgi:hypothetical protein